MAADPSARPVTRSDVSRPGRFARHSVPAALALCLAGVGAATAATPAAGPSALERPPATRALAEAAAPAVPPRGLIVAYRPGTAPAARSSLRAAERLELIRSLPTGAEVVRPRGRSLDAAAASLRSRGDVGLVVPDRHRAAFNDPTAEPRWRDQWGHHNTGQPVNGYTGVADVDVDGLEALRVAPAATSVIVAVIDDGVDFSHPDLTGNQWVNPGESGPDAGGADRASNGVDDDGNGYTDDVHGWDFCNDDNTVHDVDQDFHGTAVASTISARANGTGMVGIAPGARIMALKFLQNEPNPVPRCGWDSMAIEAIAYATRAGAPIINASWGGRGGDPLLEAAIEGSGALFVAAAGNAATDIDADPVYPAAFDAPNILTVAAIHNEGGLAGFSNRGVRSVDIAAPGEDIVVARPGRSGAPAPGWALDSGTSFAAPYVAGIAALAGGMRPTLLAAPLVLRDRVIAAGTSLPSTRGLTRTGRLANARGAVDFTPPALGGGVSILPTASLLGTASVRTRLAWGAGVDDIAMGSYSVEQRRNAGAWTVLTPGTTARAWEVVVNLSGTYQFRVIPVDAVGNRGTPIMSRTVGPTRFEESSAAVAYSGTWRPSSGAYSGRAARYTTTPGSTATLTFGGRTAAIVAPMGPTRSSIHVYLDGAYVRTVSLYSSTVKSPMVVFTTGTLSSTTHTLRLVHAPVGSRTRADVDAFVVLR